MKKLFRKGPVTLVVGLAMAASLFTACGDDSESTIGNWIQSNTFTAEPRSSSAAFTIDNKGYVGTGYDGDDYMKDFWVFNMQDGSWEQLADFPGEARSSAVAFTINGKGYLGTGYNGTSELSDFYEYNPTTNAWVQIANFGGTARRAAVGFNSAVYGFVGTGFDGSNDKKDFWKYDPATNAWNEIYTFGGNKRREGTTFTIGTNVYVGTGSSNGLTQKDFWVFDTTAETWTRLHDLDYDDSYGITRANAVGFAIGSYGYIATGDTNSVWEYNPSTDTWDNKTNFEGSSRQDAVAIYNGSQAFIALGKYGNSYYDDMWEFKPMEAENDDD
jgi:N-acetylneuraminic acid mutarotase